MIERREYIDRIRAALDVWGDELRRLEMKVIEGDATSGEIWEQQRQELQLLLLVVQENILCLRHQVAQMDRGRIAWHQVCRDLEALTERLYAGN